jgi:hypothetical protein
MNLKKLTYVALTGAALCLAQSAVAWPDTGWTGLGNDGLWSNPANWSNGSPGTGDTNQSIQIDGANGWSNIVIQASDVFNITAGDYPTVFGPEFGATLDIYGTLSVKWYLAPVGNDPAYPATVNMYDNAAYYGEGIATGYTWWTTDFPYVTMNMYGNSFVGVNWTWWGGRMNLYDNAIFSVTNGVSDGTAGNVSDSTRFINIESNAMLILPSNFGATVTNWVSRGVLLVYGVPGDLPELVVDMNNATWPGRTVVTTTATNANPMVALRIEVVRTNVYSGGLLQAQVYADYSNNTNVNVTSLSGLYISYSSSDTSVATVSTGGRVRAVGTGTASINVFYTGGLSNSVDVTVSLYTNTPSLVHRYSFNESGGSTATDSVGGSSWDGTLNGGAALSGGQLTLDGASGYVDLPAGLVSNMDAITIEAWATMGTPAAYAPLYAFGDFNGNAIPEGRNYIMFQPFTGAVPPTANMTFGTGDPGYLDEEDATLPLVSNNVTNYLGNVYLACVYHPLVGYVALYTNGVLAAVNSNVLNMVDVTLGTDPYNYLGLSLYAADPFFAGSIDEMRIYHGALTAGQIAADNALGTEQFIGTNTNVSLDAADAGGGNVALTWPTNSALVDVMASPALGTGATWSRVNGGYTLVNGKYQLLVPVTSTARFFRLQK